MDILEEYEAWSLYMLNEFEPSIAEFKRMKHQALVAGCVVVVSGDEHSVTYEGMLVADRKTGEFVHRSEEWWRG